MFETHHFELTLRVASDKKSAEIPKQIPLSIHRNTQAKTPQAKTLASTRRDYQREHSSLLQEEIISASTARSYKKRLSARAQLAPTRRDYQREHSSLLQEEIISA
ncbi:MAG: hypothetical protein OXI63_05615, partial [Candidatus Poribacteria bacterium]|nr:hypothetical protein [Candidatus Poribacteria bacterium]